MNLLDLSLAKVRAENSKKPYPTKAEYDKEVFESIRRFQGKPIFDAYH